MKEIFEVILDGVIDSLKLLPFLFLTYLVMEWIEERAEDKTERIMKKSGRFGPIIGGVLGIVPQCGFGAAASNLYAGRVITVGTLVAVFLSTSDEMLPIMISETSSGIDVALIWKILLLKLGIAIIVGLLADLVVHNRHVKRHEEEHLHIHDLCEHDHCHCEKGILYSAVSHTLQIFAFLLLITVALNLVIYFVGEEQIAGLMVGKPIVGPFLAAVVGLIPNCAASVLITQLFLQGVIGGGAAMAGLLVSAGVSTLVLCKTNHHAKENVIIIGFLYAVSVVCGIIIELTGILA